MLTLATKSPRPPSVVQRTVNACSAGNVTPWRQPCAILRPKAAHASRRRVRSSGVKMERIEERKRPQPYTHFPPIASASRPPTIMVQIWPGQEPLNVVSALTFGHHQTYDTVVAYLAIVERREHHTKLELVPFQPGPEVTRSLPHLLFFSVPGLERPLTFN